MNEMENVARMRLELSSRAENVPVVRQSLGGFAEAVGLRKVELNDLLTAVTEACNNVSVHAYSGGEGPLMVELCTGETDVVVTVRDRGVGMTLDGTRPLELHRGDRHGLGGLGLPVIQALTAEASWSEPKGGGTEVRMRFSTHRVLWQGASPGPDVGVPAAVDSDEPSADTIAVALAPLAIARGVLPRLMQAMAARAHFPIERHGDVQRVSSTLLRETRRWSAGPVRARLTAGSDSLQIAIGPLNATAASRLVLELREVEPPLDPWVAHFDDRRHELQLSVARAPSARAPQGEV